MADMTYEFEDRQQRLETYEWDNVWWEHANTVDVPRVLYIGDSISCGTRREATATAEGKIFFDGFGTSKAVDNPYYADTLRLFAKQQGKREVVLFNNGLHGWHLDDETDYAREYEKMVCFLMKEFEGTPILLVLTTHVANEERDARVQVRNRVVCELAKKYGLSTVDLYTLTKEHSELLGNDGVHLSKEGYQLLASTLVGRVKEFISNV